MAVAVTVAVAVMAWLRGRQSTKAQCGECAGRPPRATRAWICRAVRRCHTRSAIARRHAHTTAWWALPLPPRNWRRDLGATSCAAWIDRADGSAQISLCCCEAGSRTSGSRESSSSGRSSASGVGGVLGSGGGGGAECDCKGRRRAWEASSSGPSGAPGMPDHAAPFLSNQLFNAPLGEPETVQRKAQGPFQGG